MIAILASTVGILAIASAAFTCCSLVYVFGIETQNFYVDTALTVCSLCIVAMMLHNTSRSQFVFGAVTGVATVALLAAGTLGFQGEPQNTSQKVISVTTSEGDTVNYELTGQLDENQVKSVSNDIRLVSSNDNERKIVFWANFAPEGSNNMGPEMHFESLEDAIARQSEKMETDPVWFANKIEYLMNGSNIDAQKVDQRAKHYIQNPDIWDEHIARVYESFGPAYEADFGSTRYESQGMYPGKTKDDMPTVTKFSTQPKMGKVLIQTYKPGYWSIKEEIMRESCDLQPSNTTGFPNIPEPRKPEKVVTTPPTKYTPPVKTTTPPPVITTTTPPVITKTTTPPPVTTTTTPVITKTTTPPPVITTTTPPVITKTTTPPPVITKTTTPKCPPQYPNCKDPEAGPDAPEGHTTAEAPVGEPEKELPPEPKPLDPKVTEEAPIPVQDDVVAPDATPPSVEEREEVEKVTPPVTEIAPQPEQPGTTIADPDAPVAANQTAQSVSDDAIAAIQENQDVDTPAAITKQETHQADAPTDAPEADAPEIELKSVNQPQKAGLGGNILMTVSALLAMLYFVTVRRTSKKVS